MLTFSFVIWLKHRHCIYGDMGVPQWEWSLFPGCALQIAVCSGQFLYWNYETSAHTFVCFLVANLLWLLLVVRDSKEGTEK